MHMHAHDIYILTLVLDSSRSISVYVHAYVYVYINVYTYILHAYVHVKFAGPRPPCLPHAQQDIDDVHACFLFPAPPTRRRPLYIYIYIYIYPRASVRVGASRSGARASHDIRKKKCTRNVRIWTIIGFLALDSQEI
jgi:hypothetical protein